MHNPSPAEGMTAKNEPEYAAVNIPDDVPEEEYDYRQRRADIVRQIREEQKAPWEFNKSALSRRYGVSRRTIHNDFKDHIKPYLNERLGEDAEIETNELFKGAIEKIQDDAEKLREDGDHDKAAVAEKRAVDVAEKWYHWLFDTGVKEKTPDKHEIDAHVSSEKKEIKAYAGVDLTSLPGVDADRMVGVAIEDTSTDGGESEGETEAETETDPAPEAETES